MAKMSFNGVDAIQASFAELSAMEDEEVLAILRPAAERLQRAHKEAIINTFVQRTGELAESIQIEEKRSGANVFYRVLPKGKHSYAWTGKRNRNKPYKREPKSNAEIAFILEHGSPRIRARHWMENANDQVRDELNQLIEQGWDEYLTGKGV